MDKEKAKTESKQPQQVNAHARFIHVSPRKLRLVADMIRKTPVDMALEQLRFSSKKAATPLAKALNSAIANAVHNFNLNKENLFVKIITIDGGPVMKRYAPRAQGSAFVERKRTSHINITLEERKRTGKKTKRSIFNRFAKASDSKNLKNTDVAQDEAENKDAGNKPMIAPKSAEKKKKNLVNLKRRLFNRKSGE